MSCRNPNPGWFSVGVRQLAEARATGLPCRDGYSHLLTRLSLRSPRGPVLRSRLLSLVGGLYGGRGVVRCCAHGCGRWRAWRTMVSPVLRLPFPL